MTPVEVFGIVVRTFGLSFSIYGIWYLIYGIATSAGLPEDGPGYEQSYYISGLFSLVVGLYFLKGARAVIRFSYGDNYEQGDGCVPSKSAELPANGEGDIAAG